MTKASIKFAQKLALKMAGVERIGDMLVIGPTSHIVRGFLFERTPAKNAYYLWALIVPLFCPSMQNLSLNYSHPIRSKNNVPVLVDINCNDDHAFALSKMLADEHMPQLLKIGDPAAFLQACGRDDDDIRVNILLDFAIAYCLIGEVKRGNELFQKILHSQTPNPILPRVQESTRQIITALENGSAAFLELIAGYEDTNLKLHFPGLIRP